jgi:hypothetical protein
MTGAPTIFLGLLSVLLGLHHWSHNGIRRTKRDREVQAVSVSKVWSPGPQHSIVWCASQISTAVTNPLENQLTRRKGFQFMVDRLCCFWTCGKKIQQGGRLWQRRKSIYRRERERGVGGDREETGWGSNIPYKGTPHTQ